MNNLFTKERRERKFVLVGQNMKQYSLFLTLFAILFGLWVAVPAHSQSTVTLTAVQPSQIANGLPMNLTLTGSGFVNGTVASLGGVGNLTTSFVNETTLTAVVPALLSPGNYTLSVTNPDGGTAALANGLTIIGPTSIQPSTVSNAMPVELAITGIGFSEGSTVVLANYGALATTFVSSNLLLAQLAAGANAGNYTLTVVNPDGSSSSLANALTITVPVATPTTATPAPTSFVRPVIVVQSYGASSREIVPGENLDFEMTFANGGQGAATNIIATFVSGDFTPRVTGGVQSIPTIPAGQSYRFFQPLTASRDIAGKTVTTLEVRVSYTDSAGSSYSETFALTFPVFRPTAIPGGALPTATPTPTPTTTPVFTPAPRIRPQLLITNYQTDVQLLEPGVIFNLNLEVQNVGNAHARRITLILGGGDVTGGNLSGTPESGGVSGAGGDFSNFAPVQSSNIRSLGDLDQGQLLPASLSLIVNATTKPGAYPLKISFVYNDERNTNFSDEQVITLLVFQRPLVDMAFYTVPSPFFAGQFNSLPIQLTNTGSASRIFGNFTVTAPNADFSNNVIFVGALEPGGIFPLDAAFTPYQVGPMDLILSVGYTDDFNQPQTLTKTLTIEVLEAPIIEPPIDGGGGEEIPPDGGGDPSPPTVDSETLGQKIWRFLLGLFGWSSAKPQASTDEFPIFPDGGVFPEGSVPQPLPMEVPIQEVVP